MLENIMNERKTNKTHKKEPSCIYIVTEFHFYLRKLPPPVVETGLGSTTDPQFGNYHASFFFVCRILLVLANIISWMWCQGSAKQQILRKKEFVLPQPQVITVITDYERYNLSLVALNILMF